MVERVYKRYWAGQSDQRHTYESIITFQHVTSSALDMTHQLSPSTGLHKSTATPPDMPTVSLHTPSTSRRRTPVQDENAVQSRIPVKSPPRSLLGSGDPPNHDVPRSPTPRKKMSVRFDGKPSIPFPKSSKLAPPVVTNPNAAVDDATPLRALTAHLPKPPPPPPLANAKKERPGKGAKGKEKDGKCQAPTYGTVWKTLLHRGKAVAAQTLDRDCESQGLGVFHAAARGWC